MSKGHCLCGHVTYEFEETAVNWRGHCHCDSCRRACSAPITTFFAVENPHWSWTGAEPKAFKSSPKVMRYFCDQCGTQMGYTHTKFDHEIHFYAASLANPLDFAPTQHFFYDEKLPWLGIKDDLKKHKIGGL